MERSIPHIRNIFSSSSRKKSTSDTQDLCQYEKSPRNRRKNGGNKEQTGNSPKKSGYDFGKENLKSSGDEHRKNSNRNGNYNTYTSKTLTEKDMKHLERHLSMKKTIRKQISRNLAQAFLDNPNIFEPGGGENDGKFTNHKSDHALPPQDVVDKTEQNVLDLLKISIDDRDSGHSSPTHEHLEDTDYEEDEQDVHWKSCSKHRNSDTKGLVEDSRSKHGNHESEKKSSSIWKMFSPRHKGKR